MVAIGPEVGEVLGQPDELCAVRGRRADQGPGCIEVAADILGRCQLNRGYDEVGHSTGSYHVDAGLRGASAGKTTFRLGAYGWEGNLRTPDRRVINRCLKFCVASFFERAGR